MGIKNDAVLKAIQKYEEAFSAYSAYERAKVDLGRAVLECREADLGNGPYAINGKIVIFNFSVKAEEGIKVYLQIQPDSDL